MTVSSPYHAGELLVQQRLGEQHIAARHGPGIRPMIPADVAALLTQQPMVTISSLDAAGQVWTSVLQGAPGFAHSPAPGQLALHTALLLPAENDVLWENLAGQAAVSLLFIEFRSRWRYRVNGRARAVATGWVIDVEQAFLNCPQYLQPQAPTASHPWPGPVVPRTAGTHLPPELRTWLATADTFFLGSTDALGAVDTAHRGGPPGFVQVEAAGTLLIPDYVGNSMYNSFGNFEVNPVAGLLFLDAAGGRTVQLTGRAEVLWHVAGTEAATGGTARFWRFIPAAWVVAPLPAPLPF